MSAFDTIIGYEDIKAELIRIVDILKNRDVYKSLGANIPHGLLLDGEPGVGKTLMAQALIAESGLPAVTCRKNAPDGEFVRAINLAFEKAAAFAPSIVFLDDMDKFASGDDSTNSQEFVTVQSCIDEVRDKDVFVLATANETSNFPRSLVRPGRFDLVIGIDPPYDEDAKRIIAHYLSDKDLADDVDPAVLSDLLRGESCATLETVINEAAVVAAFERQEKIGMRHMVDACLSIAHDFTPAYGSEPIDISKYTIESAAVWHEAGHAVVQEILMPGSVVIATVQRKTDASGIVTCQASEALNPHERKLAELAVAFGGQMAVQHRFSAPDFGASSDLMRVGRKARRLHALLGMSDLSLLESATYDCEHRSDMANFAIANTLQQAQQKALEIVATNHEFLERVAHALAANDYLLGRDIQVIKGECAIVNVTL